MFTILNPAYVQLKNSQVKLRSFSKALSDISVYTFRVMTEFLAPNIILFHIIRWAYSYLGSRHCTFLAALASRCGHVNMQYNQKYMYITCGFSTIHFFSHLTVWISHSTSDLAYVYNAFVDIEQQNGRNLSPWIPL